MTQAEQIEFFQKNLIDTYTVTMNEATYIIQDNVSKMGEFVRSSYYIEVTKDGTTTFGYGPTFATGHHLPQRMKEIRWG